MHSRSDPVHGQQERFNIPEHSAAVKVHFKVIQRKRPSCLRLSGSSKIRAEEEPELCSNVNSPSVDFDENGSFSPPDQCLRAHKPHTR